jgi:hypothetical protein
VKLQELRNDRISIQPKKPVPLRVSNEMKAGQLIKSSHFQSILSPMKQYKVG